MTRNHGLGPKAACLYCTLCSQTAISGSCWGHQYPGGGFPDLLKAATFNSSMDPQVWVETHSCVMTPCMVCWNPIHSGHKLRQPHLAVLLVSSKLGSHSGCIWRHQGPFLGRTGSATPSIGLHKPQNGLQKWGH